MARDYLAKYSELIGNRAESRSSNVEVLAAGVLA
jgi:hypothetical protein